MSRDKMTILFCSCDKYRDLWNPFFTVFSNHWEDCNYDIIINTESENFAFPGLKIKCFSLYDNQKVTYGKRMIEHIKRIETPYTLLVLDDFFLRRDVDSFQIDKLIEYMDVHDEIVSIRLTPYQLREAYQKCIPADDLPGYYKMPLCSSYKLNFQVCLWRTDKLLSYWRPEDDPWRWEVFANITSFSEPGFLIVGEENGPVLDYGYKVNGQPLSDVYRGKWVMENGLEELFAENGVVIDFSKRGKYNPQNEPKHFKDVGTVFYIIRRIGIKDSIVLGRFIVINSIKKMFRMHYVKPNQYYTAFEKRKKRDQANEHNH